jgi:uncharacterized protein involved in exopolysaccharide biosynthesis
MAEKNPDTGGEEPKPPYPPAYPPPWAYYPAQDEIDLREYWNLLVENRKLIGIITGACTVIALITSLVMTPVYRASTVLAPVSEDKTSGISALVGQFSDLAALAGINLGGENSVDESIATLNSRKLGIAFIHQEKMKPILFSGSWDAKTKTWRPHWWSKGSVKDAPTDLEAFKYLDKSIRSVSYDSKTNLVTLSVEWKDPVLAAKWANDLVAAVNEERRNQAIDEAQKSIDYLEQQLGKTGLVDVQEAIYKLIEAEMKTKMLASTREQYAFQVIDPALPPEEKARPHRVLIVVLGFLVGIIAGMIVVLIQKNLKRTEGGPAT